MAHIQKWFTIFIIFLLTSCSVTKGKEIIDRSGRTVIVSGTVNRIVSTAPSNTEIIVDLGQADKLVAIDRHSANVDEIPGGLPLLDFFYPDAELIINLEPDIIIASGHNPTGSGEDPFRLLREMGIPVAYIPMSRSIDDIYRDIAFIADLLEVPEQGEAVIDGMKSQIVNVLQSVPHNVLHNAIPENTQTVYFEISAAPQMMSFGKNSFIHDMITIIGAHNIFANEDWLVNPGAESIIAHNPDIILTTVNYISDPVNEIKNRPGFNHINAVMNNRVYQIDTDSSVRPSPRIILALRQIAQAVYGDLYE